MAVTVFAYNNLTLLIASKAIDFNNLRFELLTNAATFNAAHASKEQVDGGSKATTTISIASPGVVADAAHGFAAGQAVAFSTTGALPIGLTASTFYYVVNPTTNNYQLAATPGGAAIVTNGSQSGVHTRYASGVNETYGNGQPPGGPTLAGVSFASAAISDALVNDAIISATNPSLTATGGPLPPTQAFKTLVWDATSFKPLIWIDHGQGQQAGITTDFRFLINALGLLNLQVV